MCAYLHKELDVEMATDHEEVSDEEKVDDHDESQDETQMDPHKEHFKESENSNSLSTEEIIKTFHSRRWGSSLTVSMSGNFPGHVSAESPSNISPNPSEVISEVSEP